MDIRFASGVKHSIGDKIKSFTYISNMKRKEEEKSRIRETPTLSTDAYSRTDTNLKKLRDLSKKKKIKLKI